jgi:histidine triad (HIT) family protein
VFDLFVRLARSRPGRKLAGWMFTDMSFAIPVKRLRETETLLAFYHPKPSYPLHVLLVPKQAVPSLMELDPTSAFVSDLFSAVQSLVTELQLPAYRLIVNGGEYQDFPHLHFHLVSEFSSPPSPLPFRAHVPGGEGSRNNK